MAAIASTIWGAGCLAASFLKASHKRYCALSAHGNHSSWPRRPGKGDSQRRSGHGRRVVVAFVPPDQKMPLASLLLAQERLDLRERFRTDAVRSRSLRRSLRLSSRRFDADRQARRPPAQRQSGANRAQERQSDDNAARRGRALVW
jgi:hypothetical protein